MLRSSDDPVSPAWISHYASGTISGDDNVNDMVIDEAGGVYVTGASEGQGTGKDFATVKYNTQGELSWIARYNSPENWDDTALWLAVDREGGAYVTGYSQDGDLRPIYSTVKYGPNGAQLWAVRYEGDELVDFQVRDFSCDNNGTFHVLGNSRGADQTMDYVLLKYRATGKRVWLARHAGWNHSNENAGALAVDASGNIYVTGGSTNANGRTQNFLTLKYSVSGQRKWLAYYRGPENFYADNFPSDIALDDSNNVYLTGTSRHTATYLGMTTIKYNSLGQELWVTRADSGADTGLALAIDGGKNIFVFGYQVLNLYDANIVLHKLDPNGRLLWEIRHKEARNGKLPGRPLVLDVAGNAYILSRISSADKTQDFLTVKYGPRGNELWRARYDGPRQIFNDEARALTLDRAGNVFAAGTSYNGSDGTRNDYALVKYDSSGARQWAARYDGPVRRSMDELSAMALGPAGEICATGTSLGAGTTKDYATVKFDSSGRIQWARRFLGQKRESSQIARAIVADAQGNVYVTGSSQNFDAEPDFATVKYNSAGEEQWASYYDGYSKLEDYGEALVVEAEGNVYVAGRSLRTSTRIGSYSIVKYNAQGEQEWSDIYVGSEATTIWPGCFAGNDSGYLFLAGSSENREKFVDYFAIKYRPDGARVWEARYRAAEQTINLAKALAVDDSGNVFVAGQSGSGLNNGTWDLVTVKYNALGQLMWSARHEMKIKYRYMPSGELAAATDDSGNVYILGKYDPYEGVAGHFNILKYSSRGSLLWGKSTHKIMTHMAVARNGDVWVMMRNGFFEHDMVKYLSNGAEAWRVQPPNPEDWVFRVGALQLDSFGNLYTAGTSLNNKPKNYYAWEQFYTVVKYKPVVVSVRDREHDVAAGFRLYQNYPNPFNPATVIRYTLAQAGHVSLKVLNVNGQEVATLVDANQSAGKHEIGWTPINLASGVYFYRLQLGGSIETRKLLLVR